MSPSTQASGGGGGRVYRVIPELCRSEKALAMSCWKDRPLEVCATKVAQKMVHVLHFRGPYHYYRPGAQTCNLLRGSRFPLPHTSIVWGRGSDVACETRRDITGSSRPLGFRPVARFLTGGGRPVPIL